MKIKTILILLFSLFLLSCQQNDHISVTYGTAGIGYEYDEPGNFEFCGRKAADEFSFTLYCFDDFRTMSHCVSGEPQRKEYFECDYQATIQIDIEPLPAFQTTDSILNQALQSRFPNQAVSTLIIKRRNGDFDIVEIQPSDNSALALPTYLTAIPHGTNYYAIITGTVSESGTADKALSAFEILAKSYEAVIGIEQ